MRNSILKLLIEHGLKQDEASKATDALVSLLVARLPKFSDSEENASKHFNREAFFVEKDASLTEFFEAVHDECRSEWDGLEWGWNDAVRKINEALEVQPTLHLQKTKIEL